MNEFSPVLDIPDLTFSVVETRAVGSVLTQISATDQDNNIGNLVSIVLYIKLRGGVCLIIFLSWFPQELSNT